MIQAEADYQEQVEREADAEIVRQGGRPRRRRRSVAQSVDSAIEPVDLDDAEESGLPVPPAMRQQQA
jgi:hypothetical protein